LAHVLVGEPVSTSPEHALADVCGDTANVRLGGTADAGRLPITSSCELCRRALRRTGGAERKAAPHIHRWRGAATARPSAPPSPCGALPRGRPRRTFLPICLLGRLAGGVRSRFIQARAPTTSTSVRRGGVRCIAD